jgi:hypothetical protein
VPGRYAAVRLPSTLRTLAGTDWEATAIAEIADQQLEEEAETPARAHDDARHRAVARGIGRKARITQICVVLFSSISLI